MGYKYFVYINIPAFIKNKESKLIYEQGKILEQRV